MCGISAGRINATFAITTRNHNVFFRAGNVPDMAYTGRMTFVRRQFGLSFVAREWLHPGEWTEHVSLIRGWHKSALFIGDGLHGFVNVTTLPNQYQLPATPGLCRAFVRRWLVLFLCGLLTAFAPAISAGDEDLEIRVKAALLFRFLQFTSWPEARFASAGSAIEICAIVGSRWGNALDVLQTRKLKERNIHVSYHKPAASGKNMEALSGCHALLISDADTNVVPVLKALSKNAILTVGEGREFLDKGGMVGFLRNDNKVQFAVNLLQVRATGVNLDANMLAYAYEVKR